MNKQVLFERLGSRRHAPIQEPLTEAKLKVSDRQRANASISVVIRNKLFDKPGHGLNKIESDALGKHGLSIEGSRSADIFLGDSGSRRFIVSKDGKELDNTMLVYSWGKSGDRGRYDATCYLS